MNDQHFKDLTEWSSSLHSSDPSITIDIPTDVIVKGTDKIDCAVQTDYGGHMSNNVSVQSDSAIRHDNATLTNSRGDESVYEVLVASRVIPSSENLQLDIDDMCTLEGQLIVPPGIEDSTDSINEDSSSVAAERENDLNMDNSVELLRDNVMIKLNRICCYLSKCNIPLGDFSPSDLVYMQFTDIRGRFCVVQDINEDRDVFQLGCHDESWEVGYEELIRLIPPLSGFEEAFISPVSNNDETLEVAGNAIDIILEEECDMTQMQRKYDMVQNLEGAIAYVFHDDVIHQANSNPKCEFCGSIPSCKWDIPCKMVSLEIETWRRCGTIPRTDEDCRLEFYKRLQDGGIGVNTCIVNYARNYFPRPPAFAESFDDYQDDMNIKPFLEFERNRQFKRRVQVVSLNAISFCAGAMARGLW